MHVVVGGGVAGPGRRPRPAAGPGIDATVLESTPGRSEGHQRLVA